MSGKIRYICPRCTSCKQEKGNADLCGKFTISAEGRFEVPNIKHFNFYLINDAKIILKKWGGDCSGFRERG